MNEDLVSSAVGFLKDPNVVSSPLTKKVEFLESKGLNQQEIEEALKRANGNETSSTQSQSTVSSGSVPPAVQQSPIDYYNAAPPQLPDRTWKDYFIMATATAGVTYGLYQVVTRYLVPSIIPPKQSSIDQDKAKIDEEFIKIDKLLETLEQDQTEIKTANEDKLKEIDIVIDNVNDFLLKYNKDKLKFDDDLRLMKLEIDNLKNSIEKNMNLTKENIKDELGEISEELTSLKNLIKARSEANASAAKDFRKIAPASSIPSASDILKKSKAAAAAAAAAAKPEPQPQPEPKAEPAKPEPEQKVPELEGRTTVGGVTAAGIPAWQLQHKENEEKLASKETPEDSDSKASGIPAWQQAGELSSIPSWQQAGSLNEDKVKEAIANVGIPSWQMNADKRET